MFGINDGCAPQLYQFLPINFASRCKVAHGFGTEEIDHAGIALLSKASFFSRA